MKDILKDLNQAQLKAVKHTDGPSMVIAGAGSGKTRVLTYKVAHLLNLGIGSAAPYGLWPTAASGTACGGADADANPNPDTDAPSRENRMDIRHLFWRLALALGICTTSRLPNDARGYD